jgi:acetate---CoA ligase (ADP-forming)
MAEAEPSLRSMLEARSVAVVGASGRPGTFGRQLMEQLVGGGFDGPIHPVNPRQDEVMGILALPSLGDLAEPVELALLAVPNELLEEQLAAAASAGARSAVIYASGHEPPEEGREPLTGRLRRIAREAGISLCGPNCMGFVNVERKLRAASYHLPSHLEPGSIALVSHSGSAWSALLHNDRDLRFNVAVSSGLDTVTTMAEYIGYAVELESTRAVALFLETARDPERFRAALAAAAERDIPVIALKVGRTECARRMVVAHSGGVAGEDAAYDAVLDAHGVVRVRTLDELADTLELFVSGRRAGPGGLAAIHDSGGERALLIDAADEVGVEFAELSPETERRIEAVLDPGLPAVNPLDAWGTGNRPHETFIACMHALLENDDTAALAFSLDLTEDLVPPEAYDVVSSEVFARTDKPVAVLANLVCAIDREDAGHVRSLGIPVLEGTLTGLAAFRHLFAHREFTSRPPVDPPPPSGVAGKWRARIVASGELEPHDEAELLRDYGIAVEATGPLPEAAVVNDVQFGPMVQLGGRTLAAPPLDGESARRFIERAGLEPGDALQDLLVRLGVMAEELGGLVDGLRLRG